MSAGKELVPPVGHQQEKVMDRMLVAAGRLSVAALCCAALAACLDAFGTSASAQAATDAARITALEQRIASLERAAEGRKAADASPPPAHSVRAPFTVVDEANRTLFQIDVDNNRARAIVGDPTGRRAVLGPNATGVSLTLYAGADSTAGGVATLIARPDRAFLTVAAGGYQGNVGAHVTEGSVMNIRNAQSTTIASITSTKDGRGYLELTNAAGSKMVEAGSLQSDKGYVLVSPYQSSMTPAGNPSVLMGGGKR